jgi:hypothetical protein
MFSPGGTVDKIFTGGAGKNGATIAVSFSTTWFRFRLLHARHTGREESSS